MKLNKKIIDRLETAVKKIIDNNVTFVRSGFINIESFILYNANEGNFGLLLFYVYNKSYLAGGDNTAALYHGDRLGNLLQSSLPYIADMEVDVVPATIDQYNEYLTMIPKMRELLPESKNNNKSKYDDESLDKLERMINRFLLKYKPFVDDNFFGYTALVGFDTYDTKPTVRLTALFKAPFSTKSSDTAMSKSRELITTLRETFPNLKGMDIRGGSTSTLDSHEENLKWYKDRLRGGSW